MRLLGKPARFEREFTPGKIDFEFLIHEMLPEGGLRPGDDCGSDSARRRRGRALMPAGRPAKARAPESYGRRGSMHSLSPDPELIDQPFVAREIARMQVIKQPTTLADQAQQTTTGMMVLLVGREVLGQLIDPGREQRDLNFRRAAVIAGSSVGLYDFPLTG